MLDVFVATSADGGQLRLEVAKQRALRFRVLDDRLDHDVRRADLLGCEIHGQARRRGLGFAGRFESFAKELVRSRESGIDVLLRAVLQRDRKAAQRAPRGDVAAHRARADDVHPIESPPCFGARLRRRSRSSNTRTRLREVGVTRSAPIDSASARNAAAPCPP